ncbi:MAG TPA: zf-TFIIB domain-containing protein [Phycisphaerae bacterium]|jgi:Zn-finger nucleic acid-binding protein
MCPVCGEPLIAFELQGIEIDHCAGCRGTWLDAGELEQIAALAQVDGTSGAAALKAAGDGVRSQRRCPRCRRKMRTVRIAGPAIDIERCARGHGLWFDAGELRRMIQSGAGGCADAVTAFLNELFRWELESAK